MLKLRDFTVIFLMMSLLALFVGMGVQNRVIEKVHDVCGRCVPAEATETQGFGSVDAGDQVETNHFATIEKQQSICAEFSGDAYVIGERSVLCVFGDLEMRGGKIDAVRARCEERGGRFSADKNGPKCDLSWAK